MLVTMADKYELHKFKHLLDADLTHMKQLEKLFSAELLETCQAVVLDELTSTESLDVQHTNHGIRVPVCSADVRQYPLVVESVEHGGPAASIGIRRGSVLVQPTSRADLLRADLIDSEKPVSVIEAVMHSPEMAHVMLKLRLAISIWQAARELISAIGSPPKFVAAYTQYADLYPHGAYELARACGDEACLKMLAGVPCVHLFATVYMCRIARLTTDEYTTIRERSINCWICRSRLTLRRSKAKIG